MRYRFVERASGISSCFIPLLITSLAIGPRPSIETAISAKEGLPLFREIHALAISHMFL